MKHLFFVVLSFTLVVGLTSCSSQQFVSPKANWSSIYSLDLSELDFWGNDIKYPKVNSIRQDILNYWNDSVLFFTELRTSIENNRGAIPEQELSALNSALRILDEYINVELKSQVSSAEDYLNCPSEYDKTKVDSIEKCDQALATLSDAWEKTGICVMIYTSFELDSLESFDFDSVTYISTLPGKYGGFCGVFPGASKLEGYPRTIPAIYVDESFSKFFQTPWVVEVAPRLWASKPDGVGTIGAVLDSSWYGDCASWSQWRDIFESKNLGFISGSCK